jgi:hypothetical protein
VASQPGEPGHLSEESGAHCGVKIRMTASKKGKGRSL